MAFSLTQRRSNLDRDQAGILQVVFVMQMLTRQLMNHALHAHLVRLAHPEY